MALTHRDIAEQLLAEGLHLTALELYAELLGHGKELRVLKEFFQDPANIQDGSTQAGQLTDLPRSTPCTPGGRDLFSPGSRGAHGGHYDITRSSSQMTLDSIDRITRYSEDTDRREEDRMAVLEYELRTARETITQLRSSIAHFTSEERRRTLSEPMTGIQDEDETEEIPLRPHEAKMLNFMINDYLVRNGYKFTAVTFSDECNEEDFDDWEEVSPASLINLFRNGGQPQPDPSETIGEDTTQLEVGDCKDQAESDIAALLQVQEELIQGLKRTEEKNRELEVALAERLEAIDNLIKDKQELKDIVGKVQKEKDDLEYALLSSESTKTELEEKLKSAVKLELECAQFVQEREEGDGASLADEQPPLADSDSEGSEVWSIPKEFYNYLMAEACVLHPEDRNEGDLDIVQILAERLPTLVSSLVLSVRIEIIPLLLHPINKHQETVVRDELLGVLVNLLKKPELFSRMKILSALVWIASREDWSVSRTEEEILPHLWQQVDNKNVEKRLLVSEGVGALSRFVSTEMRTSLLYSLLSQLLTDIELDVVLSSIKSMAILLTSIEVEDKIEKLKELILDCLNRHSFNASIIQSIVRTLLPVLSFKISQDSHFCFCDLVHVILDSLPNSHVRSKLSLLTGVLPLLSVQLALKSPSLNTQLMMKSSISNNLSRENHIRAMFGEEIEKQWISSLSFYMSKPHESVSDNFKVFNLLQRFCDLISAVDSAVDILQKEDDNLTKLFVTFLLQSNMHMGSNITQDIIIDPLIKLVEDRDKIIGQNCLSAIIHFLVQQDSLELSEFLFKSLRTAFRHEEQIRTNLKHAIRFLCEEGQDIMLVSQLRKYNTEPGSDILYTAELTEMIADCSSGSTDIKGLVELLVGISRNEQLSVQLCLLRSTSAILLKQLLEQTEIVDLEGLLDTLMLTEEVLLQLLAITEQSLRSSQSSTILLSKVCGLPETWSLLTPNYSNRCLCSSVLQTLSAVPQAGLSEETLTEIVLPGLAGLLELIQSNPALTADCDPPAEAHAGTSYLETALLMLMSEVEVARRSSYSQHMVQPTNMAFEPHQEQLPVPDFPSNQDDGREDEVVGPSPSVHGGTRVKEKMQKLFNNSPSPRNIFKKSKD